jgi:hypothetical protein
VQEDHGQRLRARVAGSGHGRAAPLDVQRNVDASVGEHALRRLKDLVPRNEGRMLVEEEVVEVVAELALDLQQVAETRGGDEERARAFALDDEVGAQGRPVHDLLHLAQAHAGRLEQRVEPAHHALREIPRGRELLAHEYRARAHVLEHEIGKGAADVEAEAPRCPSSPFDGQRHGRSASNTGARARLSGQRASVTRRL